ncbi:MAG: helix-turn-helix domain-containing protein [Corynebacterium sp.]|nr:helix-turn-helix domain-containing protein [Corynebacterium sp.]
MLSFQWLYNHKGLDLEPIHTVRDELGPLQTNEDVSCEFILPGAVVLTAGRQVKSVAELSGYVRNLHAHGAVGIGFGIEVAFDELPEEVRWTCEQLGLELFVVPKPVAFATIIQTVQAELVRRSREDAEWLVDFHERCNASASRGGLDSLCEFAAEKLGLSLAIVDNDGRVQAEAGAGLAVAVGRDLIARGQGQSRALKEGEEHGLVQRLRGAGERFYLLVGLRIGEFDGRMRTAFKHVSGLAEILLQQPVLVRHTHSEINRMAMALLIGGTHEESRAINRVFRQVIDSEGCIRPAVIEAPDPSMLEAALAHVDKVSEERGRALFALPFEEDLALIFFRGSRKPREIRADLALDTYQLRCAIGAPTRLEDISKELTNRLTVAAKSTARGTVSESSLPSWLSNDVVAGDMRLRRAQTFDLLEHYDKANRTELRPTLEAYVRLDGQLQHVAETLGVHRHTVRTRVQLISQICDIDMSDPVVKAELLFIFLATGPGLTE